MTKMKRGFAAMDEVRQRAIASEGGRAAHRQGTAHEFTSEEAAEAGRKGGRIAHQRGVAHEWDEEEARQAGRLGGRATHANRGRAKDAGQGESQRQARPKNGEAQASARSRKVEEDEHLGREGSEATADHTDEGGAGSATAQPSQDDRLAESAPRDEHEGDEESSPNYTVKPRQHEDRPTSHA